MRGRAAKHSKSTAAILDSQRVKSDPHGGAVGYDAAKKIKGRKRHLLVDTLGLLPGVHVTPGSTPEGAGAQALLARVLPWSACLRLLWVDGGYTGTAFANWVRFLSPKLDLTVFKRFDNAAGFTVPPRRWFVERTIGCLIRHHRLIFDYETSTVSAEALVLFAMRRSQTRKSA